MAKSKRKQVEKSGVAKPSPVAGGGRCGLCGERKSLTKTECCANWICDDESEYRLFSHANNSCSRNHRRQTLCGFHAAEEHAGTWQECVRCKSEIDGEMYVYYGTNDYNFELLPNPPNFEPTLCSKCGRRIVLSEGGYSQLGDQYTCLSCGL